ncbi:MAG: hypothetical protein ABMA13_23975 [Chthoniobacteraceae bacterium]
MNLIKSTLAIFAVLLVAFTAIFKSVPLAAVETIVFGCALCPSADWLREYRLGTPTLITSILTGKIIAPLLTKVPELGYFSTDFGNAGGEFAPPVKFGQEVISHLIAAPTAEAFTPGGGLGSNSQNPKDLLTDAKVKIDMAAKVTIKLPVTDAIKYLLSPAFSETLNQGTIALGRYVVGKVVNRIDQRRFSQEMVVTKAANEFSKLNAVRAAMNKLGTLTPRFILGETDWMTPLAEDPVITSGDYFGQRTGDDPYLTVVNVAGFSQAREYPNMATNSGTLGTFTANASTNVITVSAAHGLAIGDRVRVSSATTLPAGLAADTDYFVATVPSTTTLTVSATRSATSVDITDTGTGTHTITKFEGLNALAFERRAIHVAFRHLLDNSELARALGIPETSKKMQSRADTGVPVTWHFWEDATGTNPTGDIFATGVVAFGIAAGREIVDPTTVAGDQAAGSGMDFGAIRLVEAAAA